MRRFYIIRTNEEDGRLLDALTAAGRCTDESALENPVCPRCGSSTLLAFAEGEDFEIVLWENVEETDGADAHAWYLICSQYDCGYQEEIERVLDPMGADIFDQQSACEEFDEYSGIVGRHPLEMMELIEYFQAVLATGQNRKLKCMLEEAEWRFEESMEWRWKWIRRVPHGKRVRFSLFSLNDEGSNRESFEGTFVAPTDDGFMILPDPGEELMLVRALDLYSFQPQRPDKEELPRPRKEQNAPLPDAGNTGAERRIRLATVKPIYSYQWVVVRGHHLQFADISRLGQYRVRCWDPVTAEALALTPRGGSYWEGLFRRSEVDARYDLQHMIKVKGHWVDVVGSTGKEEWPYVRTEDPEVAAALGLEEAKPLFPPETEEEIRKYRPHWSGGVPESEIEDRKEVRLYYWPLPEFKVL